MLEYKSASHDVFFSQSAAMSQFLCHLDTVHQRRLCNLQSIVDA